MRTPKPSTGCYRSGWRGLVWRWHPRRRGYCDSADSHQGCGAGLPFWGSSSTGAWTAKASSIDEARGQQEAWPGAEGVQRLQFGHTGICPPRRCSGRWRGSCGVISITLACRVIPCRSRSFTSRSWETLLKWLKRRNRRHRMNGRRFYRLVELLRLPEPRIVPYPRTRSIVLA